MKIIRHKKFQKSFQKLSPKIQRKVQKTVLKFSKNPFDESLKNHVLRGRYKNKRSISVGGDLRIIFEEKDDYILVIMIDLGTHSELY